MRASEEIENGHAAQIESGGIRGQETILLRLHTQPHGHVALFQCGIPVVTGAKSLNDDALLHAANHIEIEIRTKGIRERRILIPLVDPREIPRISRRSQQSLLLTGPGCKHQRARQHQLASLHLRRQKLRDLQHPSDTGSIVIRPVMNLRFGRVIGTRIVAACDLAQMIHMRTDQHRRSRGCAGKLRQDIAPRALFLMDVDVPAEFQSGNREALHHFPLIQRGLELRQIFPSHFQPASRHLIRDRNRRHARTSQRGIEPQRHQLRDHFRLWPTDDDDALRTLLTGQHGLATQAGMREITHAFSLGQAIGQIAQQDHPLILHISVNVTRILRRFFLRRHLHSVTSEHHACRLDLAHIGEGQRCPITIQLRWVLRIVRIGTQDIRRPQGNTSREFKRCEERAPIPRRFQTQLLKFSRHVVSRKLLAPGSREPTFEFIAGKIHNVALQISDIDVLGAKRGRSLRC